MNVNAATIEGMASLDNAAENGTNFRLRRSFVSGSAFGRSSCRLPPLTSHVDLMTLPGSPSAGYRSPPLGTSQHCRCAIIAANSKPRVICLRCASCRRVAVGGWSLGSALCFGFRAGAFMLFSDFFHILLRLRWVQHDRPPIDLGFEQAPESIA